MSATNVSSVACATLLPILVVTSAYAEMPYDAVCKVEMQALKNQSRGSGVLIGIAGDTGIVLTAKSVAQKYKESLKCIWRNVEHEGYVFMTHRRADAAIVICKRPKGIKPARYREIYSGPLTICGYPERDNNNFYTGTTTWLYEAGESSWDGLAGAPCFDNRGYVVGVVSKADRRKPGIITAGNDLTLLLYPKRDPSGRNWALIRKE